MADDVTPPEDGQGDVTPPDTGQGSAISWVDSFDGEAKGYIENKGWKEPGDLLASYQNLEKLRGVPEDRLLTLPSNPEDKDSMGKIYAKLGRPEAPDGYTNVLGDGFSDDVYKAAAQAAFESGVSDKAFSAMQKVMADQSQSLQAAQEEQSVAAFDAWKGANPDGFANAARIMAAAGMTEDGVAAMLSGDKTAIYDFAAKVGARTAEKQVIHGDQPGGGFNLTKEGAKAKIGELLGDDAFMKRYMHDDIKVRQPALDQMARMQEIAAK